MTSSIRPYLAASGLVAAAAAIGAAAPVTLQTANVSTLFVFAILVVALYWGQRPSLYAAALSAVVFDLCFVPPYFTFAFTDAPYMVTATGFFVVAVATGTLSARVRDLALAHEATARAEARAQVKDEILNHISHELRAPLTSVLGWVMLLRQAPPENPAVARALAGVERSAQLIGRLVDDLLTTARINSGKLVVERRPTPLTPIVELSAGLMRQQAVERGQDLRVEIDGDCVVMADAHRVEQIVTNLLSNAIKFTPSGGSILVRLEADGATVRLIVQDTGVGIRRDFLPRVFEQFSQGSADHVCQGLGLGLAIVHHLVTAHEGTVTIDSPGEGGGTTVTVSLPYLTLSAMPTVALARAVIV
jgi:signal transduction histidine kinase